MQNQQTAARPLLALYTCGLVLGLLLASPWFLFRVLTRERYRRGLLERLALRLPQVGSVRGSSGGERQRAWVHAASAGEMVAAAALIKELARRRPDIEVVVSSTTTSGVDVAARLIPECVRFLAPIDIGPCVRRLFHRVDPVLLVLIELELWPTLLDVNGRAGVPIVVGNGRIGATTARRLGVADWIRRFVGLFRVDIFAVQSAEHRDRLLSLGVNEDRIVVTGNLKVDVAPAEGAPDRALLRSSLRARLGVGDHDFVVVAGSTHPGEESAVASAIQRLSAEEDADARPTAGRFLLVVAPRHKERLADAESALHANGFRARRWSACGRPESTSSTVPAAVVVDTMGELAGLYAAADAAFVGGSLFPGVGGHNVFEPAQAGAPVIIGPHIKNVRSDVLYLEGRGAICVLQDEGALLPELRALRQGAGHERARAGLAAVFEAQGAARRTIDVVLERCLSLNFASSG